MHNFKTAEEIAKTVRQKVQPALNPNNMQADVAMHLATGYLAAKHVNAERGGTVYQIAEELRFKNNKTIGRRFKKAGEKAQNEDRFK